MRIIRFSVIVQAPLLIAAFLSHGRLTSIALFSAGVIVLCLNGGLFGATLQALSPEPMRGRIFAIYVILANVVGAGLGPWITGMMTQYLFGGPMRLGYALATLAAVTLPAAAVILSLALGPVRRTARRLRDAAALD
jgi:MFS family permease